MGATDLSGVINNYKSGIYYGLTFARQKKTSFFYDMGGVSEPGLVSRGGIIEAVEGGHALPFSSRDSDCSGPGIVASAVCKPWKPKGDVAMNDRAVRNDHPRLCLCLQNERKTIKSKATATRRDALRRSAAI